MSTVPACRNGSRLAETVSLNSMSSAAMPSAPATILAISMSMPSGSFVAGLRKPTPGWSYFTPIMTFWAWFSWAIVVPAGNCVPEATGGLSSSSPPQAARLAVRIAAAANARVRRSCISYTPFRRINRLLQDLGEEVLRTVGGRVIEERHRRPFFDDAAAIHEGDSIGDRASEADLV